MSARITWQPSTDADIASYDLEKAASIGGPWSLLANVPHNLAGANWDSANTVFFYLDATGSETTFYRLTAIDALAQRSPVSTPFRAAGTSAGAPALVNSLSIVVGDVGILLDLGFTTIEVWASDDEGGVWTELTLPTLADPDTRIVLVDGATIYNYYDVAGTSARRYRWRFSANGAAPISSYSQHHNGKPMPVAGAQLSVATARFTTLDGRPARRKMIFAVESQTEVGDFSIGQDTLSVESDENGYLQIPLVQGAVVRVAIEGTSIVRTITVPSTPSFNVLQAVADAPDEFTVQTVPPLLTRRSI